MPLTELEDVQARASICRESHLLRPPQMESPLGVWSRPVSKSERGGHLTSTGQLFLRRLPSPESRGRFVPGMHMMTSPRFRKYHCSSHRSTPALINKKAGARSGDHSPVRTKMSSSIQILATCLRHRPRSSCRFHPLRPRSRPRPSMDMP
jgi:hypothetical protein